MRRGRAGETCAALVLSVWGLGSLLGLPSFANPLGERCGLAARAAVPIPEPALPPVRDPAEIPSAVKSDFFSAKLTAGGKGYEIGLLRTGDAEGEFGRQQGRLGALLGKYPGDSGLKRFGFRVRDGKPGGAKVLEVPTVESLNQGIEAAAAANPTRAPAVRFVSVEGQIDRLEYFKLWSEKGQVPISGGLGGQRSPSANLFFHDTQVHAPVFVALPRRVVEASRARARTLLELRAMRKEPAWTQYIDSLMAKETASLDSISSKLADEALLAPGAERQAKVAEQLRRMTSSSELYQDLLGQGEKLTLAAAKPSAASAGAEGQMEFMTRLRERVYSRADPYFSRPGFDASEAAREFVENIGAGAPL